MRRIVALALLIMLTGCREVRVKTYAQGITPGPGGNAIVVVHDRAALESLGIRAPVRFKNEFGVVLIMGPHRVAGYHQVVESIRANENRVRIVAFEVAPIAGAEPAHEYRTYTLWVVPNAVYRRGSHIDVVTPSDDAVASTVLH
ncbi:MAG: hypothetical protein M3N19_09690 [Candidatus Eremiobacteraeota bacterium]|nr:hypothetical protein [Candidatus Eremiobacteraeota bacterium]